MTAFESRQPNRHERRHEPKPFGPTTTIVATPTTRVALSVRRGKRQTGWALTCSVCGRLPGAFVNKKVAAEFAKTHLSLGEHVEPEQPDTKNPDTLLTDASIQNTVAP